VSSGSAEFVFRKKSEIFVFTPRVCVITTCDYNIIASYTVCELPSFSFFKPSRANTSQKKKKKTIPHKHCTFFGSRRCSPKNNNNRYELVAKKFIKKNRTDAPRVLTFRPYREQSSHMRRQSRRNLHANYSKCLPNLYILMAVIIFHARELQCKFSWR